MRIAELSLERYGRFEGHELVLPRRDQDFHLIYGPNEAGKTTTLCALADLLFGFEHRITHAYRFPPPNLRVGAVLEAGEERLFCRRRRGRTGTLVDAEDTPLEEGRLIAMLNGVSREAFLQSSSLDHARLRDGGRAMAESRDDLGQMLFAAGSGVTNLRQLLGSLDAELDSLWAPRRAERRAFTQAEARWKEARAKLREVLVKPADWTRANTERDDAQTAYAKAEAEHLNAVEALSAAERLRRVFPLLIRRRGLITALAEQSGPLLPEAIEAAAREALSAAAQHQQKRDAAGELYAAVTEKLEAEPDMSSVVDLGDQIDSLVQDLSAEQDRREARSSLQAEVETAQSALAVAAGNLDLKAEAALTAPAPAAAIIQQLRDHAKRRFDLAARVAAANDTLRAAREEREAADRALAEAEPPGGVGELEGAVTAAQSAGDLDTQIQKQAGRVRTEREGLTQSLGLLKPWVGEVEALAAPVPLAEELVDRAVTASEDHAREKAEAERRVRDTAEALEIAEAKVEASAKAEGVVSFEALRDARSQRDQTVQRIAAHLKGSELLATPAREAEALQQTVTTADDLADRRFAAADAAAQLALAEAGAIEADIRYRTAQDQLKTTEAAIKEEGETWRMRLQAQGLPDLPPLELRAWLRQRALCLSAQRTVQEAEAELDELMGRRHRLRRGLAAALGEPEGDVSEALQPRLTQATAQLQLLKSVAAAFDRLKAESKTAHRREEEAVRSADAAQRQLDAWQTGWAAFTAEANIVLPPLTADLRLSAWEELARVRDQLNDAARRLEQSDALSASFSDRAREVAASLSLVSSGDGVEVARQAKSRLETARAAAGRLQALREEAQGHEAEQAAADAALKAAEAALADAFAATGASDRLSLAFALDQARDRRELEASLRALEQDLHEQAEGVALGELEAACAELSADQLSARAEDAKRKAEETRRETLAALTAKTEAEMKFSAFEDQQDAADRASDVELARAELEILAETYILKRTQRLLLEHAMKRQAERARHPLLTRASELFQTLTLRRYAELIIDREAEKPRLLGVCEDGQTTVQVDDMSEGTQDQLFLALRLAAVEQSIANGTRLPFLADDLFVTFDDDRARSGLQVLGELSRTAQVLFFTHHAHLRDLAETVFPGLTVHDLQEAA